MKYFISENLLTKLLALKPFKYGVRREPLVFQTDVQQTRNSGPVIAEYAAMVE
jgi:hypothetical protein